MGIVPSRIAVGPNIELGIVLPEFGDRTVPRADKGTGQIFLPVPYDLVLIELFADIADDRA